MLMWKKYLKEVEKFTGLCHRRNHKISSVSWRNKSTGWHDSYVMEMIEDHLEKTPDALDSSLATKEKIHYTSLFSGGDLFYQFFLNGICLGKACYDRCDYRSDNSAADMRRI